MEGQGNGLEEIGAVLGSEASGDFLFYLGHVHRLLGKILRKGDVVVGRELPDIVGVGAQEQVGRLALSRLSDFSTS